MPPPIQPAAPPPSDQPDEPPDEPPPSQANTNELPKAHQPFDPTWPVHYLGKMDVMCKRCNAYHWINVLHKW